MRRQLPQQSYVERVTVFDVIATAFLVVVAIGLLVVFFGAVHR